MYYNDGTGCYCNDYLEQILDTPFRFQVPYKIDKENYKAVLDKYCEKTRIPDATVLEFSMHYDKDEDDELESGYAFFAFPKNSPKGSKDFYDCVQFRAHEYECKQKEAFETFLREILACVIGPSYKYIVQDKADIYNNINKEMEQLGILDKIMSDNQSI